MINLNQKGQILIVVFVALGVVLFSVLSVITGAQLYFQNAFYNQEVEEATALAEAGVDKAIASLNKTGGNYNGESGTALGGGFYSVTITSVDAVTKSIASTGYVPNISSPKAKRTVKVSVSKGIGASFVYGIQVGEGGLQLGNSNVVSGTVYSNGSITGSGGGTTGNNNQITGDVWIAGGTQVTPDQSTDCSGSNCSDYLFGKTISGESRLNVAQSFKLSNPGILNKISLKLKEIGNPSDSTVRILADKNGIPDKNIVITSGTLSSSLLATIYGFIDITFSYAPFLSSNTTYWIMISTSSNNSKYFSWQNDLGQSYTSGLSKWSADWQAVSPLWSAINGDLSFKVYLGSGVTQINGGNNFTVGGNVHANTIQNLTISKDAYYKTLVNTTVSGIKYPNSDDPPPKSFPLSDANIAEWKQQAENAGVTTGDISSCINLQPGKIIGNVTFNSNCNITAKSPIWITGNFTINTNNTINLDPSYGVISGVIVADGIITLGSNNHVNGSGTGSSVLLLLSTYDSRANGVSAIQVNNTGNIVVLYADKGIIEPGNSNNFKELTAWGIKLINNGVITYDTGLSSSLFSSGPSGTYSLIKGTYQVK